MDHWKNDEMGYCKRLLKTKGNAHVGFKLDTIVGYLRTQAIDAINQKRTDISSKLIQAAIYLEEGDWDRARKALEG